MANRTYEANVIITPHVSPLVSRIGHTLRLSGLIFQGMGDTMYLFFPDSSNIREEESRRLTIEEWAALLKQSDDPIIFQADETGQLKPWIRKSQSAISSHVQQQIWVRDGFKCMYCNRKMGEVVLTIDHFVPLELAGLNTPENFLSCCRRCNKDKGNMSPEEWCLKIQQDYQFFVEYLNKTR